ncbi:MAG: amidohydrolase family protein [Opitutae bacterium]|nr:amidohydrolase family protein [Opitutae bacterium]MBT4224915.1 amidohydrolase family protein [Opitutae bacterium]MBT5378365.1 amidohydrolase family protein [Opitutae bacterium]MBT5691060.1 amidohydrolase family protein [Opitutae bacterium]MBT6462051.1 amidohydrolase family protein [Opitutae bacterium]
MKIDSHHHFWNYDPVAYSWIGDHMAQLRNDFTPDKLLAETQKAGIDGVISVQASQTLDETDFLNNYAKQHDFIKGVVGWVPFADPDVEKYIERFAEEPKIIGMRHVVQDEPDDAFILGKAFNEGISHLKKHELIYDILIYERQLAPTIEFVDQHPEQVFVLDHIAKPRIGDGLLSPWKEQIHELAKRENIYCKLSGVATEADWSKWTEDQLLPYLEIALEAFGPTRMMFGSDWPVALLAIEYSQWISIVDKFASVLSESEKALLWGEVAVQAYGLKI